MLDLDPRSRNCPICGTKKLDQFQAHAFDAEQPTSVNIIECDACAFAWQYPLGRSRQESVEHFEQSYKAQGKRGSSYFDPAVQRRVSTLQCEFLAQLSAGGKRLLDVGAGSGVFAQVACEHGWTVTALDPALDSQRLAENKDITYIRGTTEALGKQELFDVVTMWDVVEHLESPLSAIREVMAHIKEGGWLVIETGNYRSADRVEGGNKAWIYQLDHRWYFSPDSMERSLTKLGFSEMVNCQQVLRPGWSGSVDYGGPSITNLAKSILKKPHRARFEISRFIKLKKAQRWSMSGMGIFTMAAKKATQVHA